MTVANSQTVHMLLSKNTLTLALSLKLGSANSFCMARFLLCTVQLLSLFGQAKATCICPLRMIVCYHQAFEQYTHGAVCNQSPVASRLYDIIQSYRTGLVKTARLLAAVYMLLPSSCGLCL